MDRLGAWYISEAVYSKEMAYPPSFGFPLILFLLFETLEVLFFVPRAHALPSS